MAQYGIGQGSSGFGGILGEQKPAQPMKPEPAYDQFPQTQYQPQAPESQMGPGAQYQQQMPGDFTSPWIGGYPQGPKKRRFPWQQDYEQPQGGMSGMQSGPGYMQQSAPWLDGNHMQGIQRRGF